MWKFKHALKNFSLILYAQKIRPYFLQFNTGLQVQLKVNKLKQNVM